MPPLRFYPIFLILIGLLMPVRRASADEVPPELAQARTLYEKDVEFALRPIRDRYLSRLDSMKRALGSRGDVRAALAVQEEIDRVMSTSGAASGHEKFAGIWNLQYQNGTKRVYEISREGKVTFKSENGSPVPPKSTKLVSKNGDVVFDIGDGSIQRISLSGERLLVEDFFPQTNYPKGPVETRATGSRATSGKP